MPYIKNPDTDEEYWAYETEILSQGDPIRVAFHDLCRNVEAFLFDYNSPGYARPEFLSWALQHAKSRHNATGQALINELRWNPEDNPPVDKVKGSPRRTYWNGVVEALEPAFSYEQVDHKTDEPKGDDQYTPKGDVTDQAYANRVTGEPLVRPYPHNQAQAAKTSEYWDWKVPDLKAELSDRDLSHSGSKKELIERLEADDAQKDGED